MFEGVTFELLMQQMLDNVPSNVDKREGSIIYDALAPCAAELTKMYMNLDMIMQETFADTASTQYLMKRCAERGISMHAATAAVLEAEILPDTIDVTGQRFNCGGLNFTVSAKNENGKYNIECETAGTSGNLDSGLLIPIEYIDGLISANITACLIPGKDEETTEELRERYFESFDGQAFGGNVYDYKQKTTELDGVGACKVIPVWNGGGTVKLIILDAQYAVPSQQLIDNVQAAIDPTQNSGKGIGLAPIGHVVTVEGAQPLTINIVTEITFRDGYSFDDIIPDLKKTIEEYFLELRKSWDENETLVVRISQIETRLLSMYQVLDIQNTVMNGSGKNLELASNQVPTGGTINGK